MFANMIQLAAKQGRGKELTKLMTDRSLNVLKQQSGFVEAIALTPETDQDQVVGISIWNSKADADRFTQGQSQQLLESYRPLLQAEPTFRSFNVEGSTTEVASARAASR
jgi:heme-degrading monooxygenase HmoA